MSNFTFPTLDSLRQGLPRQERIADDVAWYEEIQNVPQGVHLDFGWSPPNIETVIAPSINLEMERQIAQDEGFRQGYAAGLRSGTEKGITEGQRQGHAEVIDETRAEIAAFRDSLSEVVGRVQPAVNRWQAGLEEAVTELAIEAVRALLAAELAIERPAAMGIVREALAQATGATRATVRLSPFDRAELAERQDEILAACAGLREVELVNDASIEGGCVIETENGIVDATLATRLALLEAA